MIFLIIVIFFLLRSIFIKVVTSGDIKITEYSKTSLDHLMGRPLFDSLYVIINSKLNIATHIYLSANDNKKLKITKVSNEDISKILALAKSGSPTNPISSE